MSHQVSNSIATILLDDLPSVVRLKRPIQPSMEFLGASTESFEVIKNAMPPPNLERDDSLLRVLITNSKVVVKFVVTFAMGSHSGMGL